MRSPQVTTSLAVALVVGTLTAQTPSTDIYLFDITLRDEHHQLVNMTKVTDREGYDNQPYFTPDGKGILFTSDRDSNQADIFFYDFATRQTTPVTRTRESEYSPMLSPSGKLMTVVKVDLDGTQRIWKMKLDGTKAKPLMLELKDIGYYCWLNNKTLAVWTVNDTLLSIVKIKDQVRQPIAKGAGRSFQLSPSLTKITYLQLNNKTNEHMMMQYNFITGAKDSLITTFAEEQDIAYHPSGELLIGHYGAIYSFLPDGDTKWQYYANLSSHKVTKFYRLAVSPDGTKLAVVVYQGTKP